MLGQALETEFSTAGWEVTGFDREELDVVDGLAVKKVLADLKPSLVINAVAINAVDKIETDSDVLAVSEILNTRVPGELAALCKENNILFVHYSSDYVFAGELEGGYTEEAVLAPLNKYGQTKAAGELAVQYNGEKYYVIRLSKLFGKPAASLGAKKSFVDTMLDLALGGKKDFDLVADELSAPTYAPDLAHLTRTIVENKLPFGIYHGTNSGACTWYQFAQEIFTLKKILVTLRPVPASTFPRPAARPHASVLVNTKLPAQRSWQEALREYLSL